MAGQWQRAKQGCCLSSAFLGLRTWKGRKGCCTRAGRQPRVTAGHCDGTRGQPLLPGRAGLCPGAGRDGRTDGKDRTCHTSSSPQRAVRRSPSFPISPVPRPAAVAHGDSRSPFPSSGCSAPSWDRSRLEGPSCAQPRTLLSAPPAAPQHPGHRCRHSSVSVALAEVSWVGMAVLGAELTFLPRAPPLPVPGSVRARSRTAAVIAPRRQRWIRNLQLVLLPS